MTHTYTVQLRIMGDGLQPADISKQLSLIASSESNSAEIGLPSDKRRPFWAYNGYGESDFRSEWDSLEEGLQFLLKSLKSRKQKIVALTQQFHAIWWCGHFQTSFDGGPTLSSDLLLELGSYGIPLTIDNYFD